MVDGCFYCTSVTAHVSHKLLNKFRGYIVLTVGKEIYWGKSIFLIEGFNDHSNCTFSDVIIRQCKYLSVFEFLTNNMPLSENCYVKHLEVTAQTERFS